MLYIRQCAYPIPIVVLSHGALLPGRVATSFLLYNHRRRHCYSCHLLPPTLLLDFEIPTKKKKKNRSHTNQPYPPASPRVSRSPFVTSLPYSAQYPSEYNDRHDIETWSMPPIKTKSILLLLSYIHVPYVHVYLQRIVVYFGAMGKKMRFCCQKNG